MTDEDGRAFFDWAARERAITRLLHAGKLGYGELALRRQMSYDRLMRDSQPERDPSNNQ